MATAPAKDKSEATTTRAITKAEAMKICSAPMQRMMDLVCQGRVAEIPLPEGADAAEVASQLGGTLIDQVEAEVVDRWGVLTKRPFAVVKVATGLLMSSISAEQIPKQLYTIEAVAPSVGWVKIKTAVTPETASETIVDIAKQIGKTAPIQGESAAVAIKKVVSEASARFQVINMLMDIYKLREDMASGESQSKQENLVLSACCDAVVKAHRKAWNDAPRRFHGRAMKTRDQKQRSYGTKRSRRNKPKKTKLGKAKILRVVRGLRHG